MASFKEHIAQAKKNIDFLKKINHQVKDHPDWQVTTAFYISVHVVNAHLAHTTDSHYRRHSDVERALNPEVMLSVNKIDMDTFLAYRKLRNLSRRSRYLCSDENNFKNDAFVTYSIHVAKAIKNLDKLMQYFDKKYTINFDLIEIDCIDLEKTIGMKFFQFLKNI